MQSKISDSYKMVNESSVNASEEWHGLAKMAVMEEPFSALVIYSVALFMVFIGSLVGNVLTCIVIYSDRSMHTATNYYLFNLAVSDLLVTFPILIFIYQLLTQGGELFDFEFGKWSCKFIICIHIIFITVIWNNGILVMTALSIERYIAICYPMMLKGTPVWRRVGKVMAMIWTVAIVETLPAYWTIDVFDTGKTLICFMLPTPSTRLIHGVLAVITFIIPLGIMTFVYTMIAFTVNDNNPKYNFKDTVLNNGNNRNKVNKLITLTVSFVVCWLPFFIIRTALVTVEIEDFARLYRWWSPAHKVAMFNSWFTAVLNPLLFSVMSTKFRKALKKLWERKLRKKKRAETSYSTAQHTSQHRISELNKY